MLKLEGTLRDHQVQLPITQKIKMFQSLRYSAYTIYASQVAGSGEKNQNTTFQDAQDASLCPWRNKKQRMLLVQGCLSKSSKDTRTHCQATMHGATKHRTRKLNSTKRTNHPQAKQWATSRLMITGSQWCETLMERTLNRFSTQITATLRNHCPSELPYQHTLYFARLKQRAPPATWP